MIEIQLTVSMWIHVRYTARGLEVSTHCGNISMAKLMNVFTS